MLKNSKRLGRRYFAIEVDPEDVDRTHEWVGRIVEVSPFASPDLKKLEGKDGKISGVVVRDGQIVALAVEIEDEEVVSVRKDFFVDRNVIFDAHPQNAYAMLVRRVLHKWIQGVDVIKGDLSAIQSLFWDLATLTESLDIRNLNVPDPHDLWEISIPSSIGCVRVQLHMVEHDGVVSVGAQVYSTSDSPELQLLSSADHWTRTLLWTDAFLRLGNNAQGSYQARMWQSENDRLTELAKSIYPKIAGGYAHQYGEPPNTPPLSLGFSSWRVQPGHVGLYEPPCDTRTYGVLSIHPKAFEKGYDYLVQVVTHELIHYAMTDVPFDDPHGEEFQELATLLGLPKKLQD